MKSFIASLLILQILLLQLAATSKEVHDWLHGDSGGSNSCQCTHHHAEDDSEAESDQNTDSESGEHICAITLYASGAIINDGVVAVPLQMTEQDNFFEFETQWISQKSSRYVGIRGPPVQS